MPGNHTARAAGRCQMRVICGGKPLRGGGWYSEYLERERCGPCSFLVRTGGAEQGASVMKRFALAAAAVGIFIGSAGLALAQDKDRGRSEGAPGQEMHEHG